MINVSYCGNRIDITINAGGLTLVQNTSLAEAITFARKIIDFAGKAQQQYKKPPLQVIKVGSVIEFLPDSDNEPYQLTQKERETINSIYNNDPIIRAFIREKVFMELEDERRMFALVRAIDRDDTSLKDIKSRIV